MKGAQDMFHKSPEKEMILTNHKIKSTGLLIDKRMNEPYGNHYKGDGASNYAGCLKCAGCIPTSLCLPCAVCGCGPLVMVDQGFVGFKIEFGKLKSKLGPGLHTYNPCSEKIIAVDMRVQCMNPPEQRLLTRDSVTVVVDICINFKITIPEIALYSTSNYYAIMILAVQSVMRSVVAEKTLTHLLTNRKEVDAATTELMDEKLNRFGIDIISTETQSVKLLEKMERAMGTVAESEKQAEAKVVNAKGSLESAKLFKEAADDLHSHAAVELKYFQLMRDIAAESPSLMLLSDSIMSQIEEKMSR